MIAVRTFANADIAVFGLARSGRAAVRSLKGGGARVIAWDDNETSRAAAESDGATIAPFADWPWDKIKAVVLSPGIALTHPEPHAVVKAARRAGVEIIGDVELFAREMCSGTETRNRAPLIAITGTNGKSTTTALIGHILASCGFTAEIGGNIGRPVLELDTPNSKTVYVLEMSSYQIDLAPGLVPDFSVLTNISPDHIDRHGSLENYIAVKARLLSQTAKNGRVAIGVDDAQSSALYTKFSNNGGADAVPVSVGKVLGRGIFAVDGTLYDAQDSRATAVMDLAHATHLPGAHNWQNIALAYAATLPFVKDARVIVDAITQFPGLAHRMEEVGHIGKVRFINDSKATNADAAARALACYPDIFWIAGGKPKQGGIESLRRFFPRLRKAYLIGEAADEFAQTLGNAVAHEFSGELREAVEHAAADAAEAAQDAPVVLLSPACASFDQFRDYEHRGDIFRGLVANLGAQSVREAS
jgi:UDP-N-acetylmuramoylalanine--D-glutamate ligase